MSGTILIIDFQPLNHLFVVVFHHFLSTKPVWYPHHKNWIRFVPSVGPSPICVRSITPLLMEGFPSNLNDPFTSTRGCAEPMCQLKVKVTDKCQILGIMSCLFYILYQRKDFLGCSEPLLPMCQLKVTVKGQILNKQILDIMSCPLYKPYTNGRISFKPEWHIHLN